MKRVFKYELSLNGPNGVEMDAYGVPLAVERQGAALCMWALVDDELTRITRTFTFYGTGHIVPDEARYIGTVQTPPFVWHLFETR
jgi:hypothetical protein